MPDSSPLQAIQARQGARFMEWQGAAWALDFGDPVAEHHAVRDAAGIWDLSPLRTWELRGPDAAAAGDRLFTNAVGEAPPGRARYGLLCDERGAIVNDAVVFRLAPDRLWLFTSRDADGVHLERHLCGDVTLEAITDVLAGVGLQGPRGRRILAALTPGLPALPPFALLPAPVDVGGVECLIARLAYGGELGYELFCAPERAEALWLALTAAGARPYGLGAMQTLRIEAGLVLVDADFIPGQTSPFDVSLDRFVRLDKPDLVGRAALAEIAASPPWRLMALTLEGDELPPPGAALVRAGERVGTVTSACRSPTLGGVIGLGRIARACAEPRTRVGVVAAGGGAVPATLAAPPLYDPERRRPRAEE